MKTCLIILAIIVIPNISMGSESSFYQEYPIVWQGIRETLQMRNEAIDTEDRESGLIRTVMMSIKPADLHKYAVIEGVFQDIQWRKAEYALEIKISRADSKTIVRISARIRGYGELKRAPETFKPAAFWTLISNGRLEEGFFKCLRQVMGKTGQEGDFYNRDISLYPRWLSFYVYH